MSAMMRVFTPCIFSKRCHSLMMANSGLDSFPSIIVLLFFVSLIHNELILGYSVLFFMVFTIINLWLAQASSDVFEYGAYLLYCFC